MKHVYIHWCLALGLALTMTACGESNQFTEKLIGDPIPANPDTEIGSKTNSSSKAPDNSGISYEGDEPETNATVTVPEATPTAPETEPTTPPVTQNESAPKLFADCEDHPEKGIVADLYELPVDTAKLPDFETMSSLRTVCLSQLNIQDREFSEGFPGVEGLFEWFALDMQFRVNAPKTGTYDFTLAADDGAILWIDGNKVIDNDGLHQVQTKTARVYLAAGFHTFHVSYYQGPRWRIALELSWKVPGATKSSYIPASAIFRMP